MNKIVHNIVLACVALLTFQSCSQPAPVNQNPNITADNLVEEIAKQVKNYPSEPQYVMHYFNGVCNFEIYINDFKVVKSFNNESFKTSERINPFLLSKNNQLKIILYPRDSVNKLNLQAGLDLKVNSYENTDRFSIEKQQSNLFIYQTPEDENGFFKYAGKEYFEQTVAFTLPDVPYKIEGWKDSQDLRNFDKKLLEQKVLQAYQMIQKSFKERDLDKIAQFSYNKMKDQAIAQYFDEEEVQEGWEELISIAGADNLEFFSLENYELVFYGEGRLVGLKSKKKDKGFRGASALLCKFKREGKWVGAELDYLLHIPKGETEFKVY
ncbi:hypothetical protein [Capnocytophaga sputigena]|uniref:hypothetical protein n=1 Tax=Capnocytophaga sputigena TaxID=1019 RepID=UPI000BB54373|nr:hypothetical protein [Capnocytophaga sputigena]PBN47224.1 hypothetical protein CDC50_01120 [Capnocytophaga sputigena]